MAKDRINGYLKWVGFALAVAAIIWNAATLHNDVEHLKNNLIETKEQNSKEHKDIKQEVKELRYAIISRNPQD